MPKSGSQIILCDLPVRFDTYEGCGHACSYCFVSRKADIAKIKLGEGVESLARWIKGVRDKSTNWCDWPIPLHWGGLSDPFQPAEKIHRRRCSSASLLRSMTALSVVLPRTRRGWPQPRNSPRFAA